MLHLGASSILQGWQVSYLGSGTSSIYIREHPTTANHMQENMQSYAFEEKSPYTSKLRAEIQSKSSAYG